MAGPINLTSDAPISPISHVNAGATIGSPNQKVADQIKLTLALLDHGKPNIPISPTNNTETVNLSNTAILLDKLLQNSNQQPIVSSSSPLLLANTEIDITQLTTQLNTAIEKSGGFYESHLQQWLEGHRQVDQIRQEPQNQSAQPAETANNLIAFQLDSLEHQRITWEGELYPNQMMQLTIHKDENQNKENAALLDADEALPIWQTSLKLQLPNLGQVEVKIRLQGEHTQLNINVDDERIASSIKTASDQLMQSLAVSGTALDLMTVQSEHNA